MSLASGEATLPLLGAHKSIAGGCYRAIELAGQSGCDCVQLFTKNNNQWRAKDLSDSDVARFKEALARRGVRHPLSHSSYLINLASPDETLWTRSVEAFRVELLRAEKLGIPYVVVHPGAFTTSSEEIGLGRVIAALDAIHRQEPNLHTTTLLENTAGQGSCLGWRFEQVATIVGGVAQAERVAVCIDTCHLFAAGYPLADKKDYEQTIDELERTIGLTRVKAIHLNDSKQGLGSRVDRHEHIGRGRLGLDAFRNLLNDPRLGQIPMYLETPKEQENGEEMDVVNLRVLRGLADR